MTSRSQSPHPQSTQTTFTGGAAVALRRSVTATVFVIAGLTFSFGFGNGYTVGRQLGVLGWIAPLVAPAVDLSVVALLAALQYLRASGVVGRLVGPRLLLIFCGLATLALNTVRPIAAGIYGRACFDAVAPLLLIGWSEVGPRLLASLQGTVHGRPGRARATTEVCQPSWSRRPGNSTSSTTKRTAATSPGTSCAPPCGYRTPRRASCSCW